MKVCFDEHADASQGIWHKDQKFGKRKLWSEAENILTWGKIGLHTQQRQLSKRQGHRDRVAGNVMKSKYFDFILPMML